MRSEEDRREEEEEEREGGGREKRRGQGSRRRAAASGGKFPLHKHSAALPPALPTGIRSPRVWLWLLIQSSELGH